MARLKREDQHADLTNELHYIRNTWQTIQNEEFPEGPYGASLFPFDKPGKVTPWESNQQVTSAFKDENPVFSDGQVPPPGDEPRGNQLEE
ncbi:hypothetical protein [Sulfoacidibacillus thermotolerans]|uniref:Uncharacterized protein n=1 Tax=Sulfoacidibacillus thermotolerans TaxID=1765684 RepID=A0A2U3DC77_SULT2|nr:hypothetical protein [Sulfoacidibacillus thermotolerans]PWI58891.1 hypothetical protein BM613_02055 [Sulfoacidibacillus thermotolerans]